MGELSGELGVGRLLNGMVGGNGMAGLEDPGRITPPFAPFRGMLGLNMFAPLPAG